MDLPKDFPVPILIVQHMSAAAVKTGCVDKASDLHKMGETVHYLVTGRGMQC